MAAGVTGADRFRKRNGSELSGPFSFVRLQRERNFPKHKTNLICSDRVQPPDFNLVTNANLRAQKAVEPNA
jgi:hypothetical protein